MTRTLDGMSVAVLGAGRGAHGQIALGLAELGAAVGVMSDSALAHEPDEERAEPPGSRAGPDRNLASVACAFRSGTDVDDALVRLADFIGRIDAVVDVPSPGLAVAPTPLADLDDSAWLERAEAPLRRARYVLEGAHRHLRGRGGRIVVVLPSASMTGAPGLVPWLSASEGHRALAKAVARAWGSEGFTINCIAVPAGLLAADGHAVNPGGEPTNGSGSRTQGVPLDIDRPGLPPPALGRLPNMRRDVAAAVGALLGDGLSFVTGLTLAVDGGVWMTP